MSAKSVAKLVAASDAAANSQVQHIQVILTADGQLRLNGSTNFVLAVNDNTELYETLQQTLLHSRQTEGRVTPSQVMTYPFLPCSPFSPEWKGSSMIRSVLTKMLSSTGYGEGGAKKKLGVGNPPLGWPENIIEWRNFSGSTRSKLSVQDVSAIVISMLQAAGINPDTHVKHQDVALMQQEQEQEQVEMEFEVLKQDDNVFIEEVVHVDETNVMNEHIAPISVPQEKEKDDEENNVCLNIVEDALVEDHDYVRDTKRNNGAV